MSKSSFKRVNDHGGTGTSHVVRHSNFRVRQLDFLGRVAPKLPDHVNGLPDSRRPHGVANGFQAARKVRRNFSVFVRTAFLNEFSPSSLLAETKVLQRHDLRDGETVVALQHVHVFMRNAGRFIGQEHVGALMADQMGFAPIQ